ncbi:Uncharacterised protein [Salmonella enterica subsp. enterica serovar Typhimurium str. DT104]|nr:Uncharacterised protein [Salmonella enterica subsp. enterica serovar Typhimurium str. DT104]CQB84467.1 Uncharacterised protein [Salmonella enterica subsp. enterica serovar Typhimurium str. DT104]
MMSNSIMNVKQFLLCICYVFAMYMLCHWFLWCVFAMY